MGSCPWYRIGVDGTRLAVSGNSVGGNMAAVISLMAKDKNGPKIKLQVSLWPVTDANFETDSYKHYRNGGFLTKNMMVWLWDNYTKNAADRTSIYASPLQASLSQIKGLPKAMVAVAENDVLRDEGEAYARKLDEAGVAVSTMRYNGMIHDWGVLNPLATVSSTRSVTVQARCRNQESTVKIEKQSLL
jgi:acetyl esterase